MTVVLFVERDDEEKKKNEMGISTRCKSRRECKGGVKTRKINTFRDERVVFLVFSGTFRNELDKA